MGGFRSSAFDGSALWLDALSRLAFCVIYASVKARHFVAATYTLSIDACLCFHQAS